MRRELKAERDWVSAYQKIVFCLNACTVKFGRSLLESPSYVLNGRRFRGLPVKDDMELDLLRRDDKLREVIFRLSAERLLETPSLSANIASRREEYSVSQKVLVWSEFLEAKRTLGTRQLRAKVSKFWMMAVVLKKIGDVYMVRTSCGRERRVHVRQIKRIPHEFDGNGEAAIEVQGC